MKLQTKIYSGYLLTMFILFISILVTMWSIKNSQQISKRISELRIPTALASATAYSGLHHSLSSLRAWILLGTEEYKVERSLAWQEEISPSIDTLTSLSVNWTDSKNISRLKEVKTLLTQFKIYQQDIEDIANTTANEPALDLLLSQAIPLTESIHQDISQLLELEEKQLADTERRQLFNALSDTRGSFALTLGSIRAFLLSGETSFKTKTITLWDQNSLSFNHIKNKTSLFTSRQQTIFSSFSIHRTKFEALWPKILAIREQDDWNLSRYWLATKAAPIGAEIGQILQQMNLSQTRLLKIDQKQVNDDLNNLILDQWILMLFGLFISTLIGWFLNKNIKELVGGEPSEMMLLAKKVANGQTDIQGQNNTATGILSSLYLIANTQEQLAHQANMIASGDFTVDVIPRSDSDALGISMQSMIKNLRNMTHAAKTVADGQFDIQLETLGKNDALGKAMQQMIKSLRLAKNETSRTAWLQKGQVLVTESLREEKSIQTLGENLLKTLSSYADAQIGTIYQWVDATETETGYLELTATYAYARRKQIKQRFQLGESLIGQAAKENKAIIVEQVPEGYIQISSSLGNIIPQNLILLPFSFHGQLRGVLELGFVREIDDQITTLLSSTIESVGVAFENISFQMRLTKSLQTSISLESEIRANEQRISTTIESLLVAVITITTRGIIETCNTTTEKLFGYRKDEMIGNNIKILMPETRAVEHDGYLKNYQQTGHAKIIGIGREVVAKRKDGSEFPIHLSVSEMKFDETISYLGTITDISKQVEQREKIIQSNMELQANTEELASQQEELRQTNETLSTKTKELEQQKKELENSQQKLEHKASELEESSRYKSEFLANMSHELRTPLNSLLILAKFLADNDDKNLSEDEVESAQIIHESGNNLLQLINDILDLSKIEAGHMNLHTDAVLLSDIQHFMDSRFKHMAEAKGIFFNIDIHANVPTCFISDYTKLGQVLTNLISNALKFTQNGGVTLVVSLVEMEIEAHQNQWLSFTVIDTGIGIPLEKQGAIFEAFQQVDGSTNRQYGGTGLGLSIASSFAKLLGGQITIESKADKGSRFTLKIPYIEPSDDHKVDPQLQKLVAQSIQPIQNSLKERTAILDNDSDQLAPEISLLIVEDDEVGIIALKKLLSKEAVNISIARTGLEAISRLQSESYSSMILDLGLPNMTGFELLEALSKDKCINMPPVIIYSGKDLSDKDHQQLQEFTSSIIIKSVRSPERLLDEIHLLIEHIKSKQSKSITPDQQLPKLAILKGKLILLVDDDMRNTFSLAKVLRSKGLDVRIAPSGQDALSALDDQTDFDLVLMDIMMPDMDGYETIQRIRNQEKFKELPIIALTANAMSGDKEKCITSGANDYLIKPVDVENLLTQMQIWL